jgi:large subunit ribosomal protein L2
MNSNNFIKTYNPYTPSLREKTTINFSLLSYKKLFTKKSPEKSLLFFNHRSRGRNFSGKITVRHKGGGHKRLYRFIDFKRNKKNIAGRIVAFEYDPNRNTTLALVQYSDGEKRYILQPDRLKIGSVIWSGMNISIAIGNALPLKNIPLGCEIHNLELYPGKGAQLLRAAGAFGKVMSRVGNSTGIRLCSKEIRLINNECLATIGKVANSFVYNVILGKAGRKRWLGIRPTVRGSVMNPIDHPHGGGEGRSPIGRPKPLTPWGKPALGMKTRSKRKKNQKFILKPRKK